MRYSGQISIVIKAANYYFFFNFSHRSSTNLAATKFLFRILDCVSKTIDLYIGRILQRRDIGADDVAIPVIDFSDVWNFRIIDLRW